MLGSGLLLGAATMLGAGRLLVRVDPVSVDQPADVIYVLGGSRVDRWLEAADLYREGAARHIVMSNGAPEAGAERLRAQGIVIPGDADIGRQVMVTQLGIPATAVEILIEQLDNTAHEAEAIASHAAARGWRSMIVITGRSTTRRAGYAFERVLGDRVEVIMRHSRHDPYDEVWWWRSRGSFRQTFYEVPKLLAYWLGLGA